MLGYPEFSVRKFLPIPRCTLNLRSALVGEFDRQ